MKRFFLILSFLVILQAVLISATVTNTTTPLKGDWDFQIKEVLNLDSYGEQLLAAVQKFAIHEDGRIFIFDRTHFKFFIFDPAGKLLASFGKRGEGPGEIKMLLDFYLLKDRIIAYDMGKIHHLSLDGKLIKSVPTSSTIGIAPNLFLDEHRLIKGRMSFGRGPGSTKLEALELFDTSTEKTIYLDGAAPTPGKGGPGGTMVMITIGNERKERNVSYITALYDKDLLWGKNDSYLIHLCDQTGKKKISFSIEGKERMPITQEFKEKLVSRMNVRVTGMSQEDLKKRLLKSIPDQCTYFSNITSDKNGLIYVYTSNAGLDNGQDIDIFSPKGKYLYKSTITIPEGNRIRANGIIFNGDFLYMVVEDDEGELSLRKFNCKLPKI